MYSRLCVSKFITFATFLVWSCTVPVGIVFRGSFNDELSVKIGYGIDGAFFTSISWFFYERYRVMRQGLAHIEDEPDDEIEIRSGELPTSIQIINSRNDAHAEDMYCPICLETTPVDVCMLKCGHKFHIECLQRHLGYTRNCPLCRTQVSPVSNSI